MLGLAPREDPPVAMFHATPAQPQARIIGRSRTGMARPRPTQAGRRALAPNNPQHNCGFSHDRPHCSSD
jgi:hypothetical protein